MMSKTNQPTLQGISSNKTKLRISAIFIIIVGFYLFTSIKTESSLLDLWIGKNGFINIAQSLFPPHWSYASTVMPQLIETLHMAIIATTVAALISIPISLLSAANLFQIHLFISRFVLL